MSPVLYWGCPQLNKTFRMLLHECQAAGKRRSFYWSADFVHEDAVQPAISRCCCSGVPLLTHLLQNFQILFCRAVTPMDSPSAWLCSIPESGLGLVLLHEVPTGLFLQLLLLNN